jgi:hypothetical protein
VRDDCGLRMLWCVCPLSGFNSSNLWSDLVNELHQGDVIVLDAIIWLDHGLSRDEVSFDCAHTIPACTWINNARMTSSILVCIDTPADTPDMEGDGFKGVTHPARIEKDEPGAVRIARHCRGRPIDVGLSVGKGMAQGQGGS